MSVARLDPRGVARIVRRQPLLYRSGADPALDRPAHVRAASGLCWVGGRLVVVQDDAAFLGVVDPATGLVDDVALPAGPDGRRLFDTTRGNKPAKPDLEVAFADDETLVALGSGGPLPARRVAVCWRPGDAPRMFPLPRLFEALSARLGGLALNLEGGAIAGDHVLLANRGGHRGGQAVSPDALVRVPLPGLRALLADPDHAPVPDSVWAPWRLGELGGQLLHFSDLAPGAGGHWYAAAAEDTASYFDDGAVTGSVVGWIDGAAAPAGLVHVAVVAADGRVARDKVEGVAAHPERADRLYAATDPDDPARPGELLELALEGVWRPGARPG